MTCLTSRCLLRDTRTALAGAATLVPVSITTYKTSDVLGWRTARIYSHPCQAWLPVPHAPVPHLLRSPPLHCPPQSRSSCRAGAAPLAQLPLRSTPRSRWESQDTTCALPAPPPPASRHVLRVGRARVGHTKDAITPGRLRLSAGVQSRCT